MTEAVDRVLTATPPRFTEDEAAAFARDLFGRAGTARAVASERDQAFFIDGDRPAVLKISNAAEDPAQLDFEALAAQRVVDVDPGLPVALPLIVPGTTFAPTEPEAYRAPIYRAGETHYARLYDRLSGHARVVGADLSDDAVRDWGTMVARVGRALRGFWHPASRRVMLWDVQHALRLWPMIGAVRNAELRELVTWALDRYESVVTPLWPSLRAQVIHTDLCASNVLVDDAGQVTGIIDFGDASWTALAVDLASVLETVVDGRTGEDFFRACRLLIDGYEKVTPLEQDERAILGELLAARMSVAVVVPASREALYEEQDPVWDNLQERGADALRLLHATGWDEIQRQLGGREPGRGVTVPELVDRRRRTTGPAMTNLFYSEPLHLVRGEGVWLIDADGRRYLDAYNNVATVGHSHPRVVEAMVRQSRRLNTNMRYLHETAFEVAERLIASTHGEMDVVLFVNSGSEANDIAWRIARAATGGTGGLCSDWAYHGITDAIHALTPSDWTDRPPPAHVQTWRPPDRLRGFDSADSLASFARAIRSLQEADHKLAASILDGVLTSGGIVAIDPSAAAEMVRLTHEAGGLWIADEVQGGYGRTGAAMWSYQRLGMTPDIVTLGKPMGDSYPVAAVLTRSDLAARFSDHDFFSTFAGSPVAMAAAKAVLEVMDDERLIDNARDVGEYLAGLLREVAGAGEQPSAIAEVRQIGLAIGVEIVRPGTTQPDPENAKRLVDGMRHRGVLIGRTGRNGNVLKVRPPLVFTRQNADQLAQELAQTLRDTTVSA
jgi:4-aminobutyrate aminotransferase-like enzyme/Ser/Thr protein kinase RdoA (MazF antagonist)